MRRSLNSVPFALLLAASISTLHARTNSSTPAIAQKGYNTITEMQEQATDFADHADRLEHFIGDTNRSWELHLTELNMLKSDVNRMGKDIKVLEDEKNSLPDWEVQAIERTKPLLQEMAVTTGEAIRYFNNNRTHLWTPQYREMADNIYHESLEVSRDLKDYLSLERAREQEQHFSNALHPSTLTGKVSAPTNGSSGQ